MNQVPNLWWGAVPFSGHADDQVVVVVYWINESTHSLQYDPDRIPDLAAIARQTRSEHSDEDVLSSLENDLGGLATRADRPRLAAGWRPR